MYVLPAIDGGKSSGDSSAEVPSMVDLIPSSITCLVIKMLDFGGDSSAGRNVAALLVVNLTAWTIARFVASASDFGGKRSGGISLSVF